MSIFNVEFKARHNNLEEAEKILLSHNPLFIGTDHQTDTYFSVSAGRLKLREGNIENALIYYTRENYAGNKSSAILLYQHTPDKNLKQLLINALGIKTVVDKQRKIYFIDNIKFHFDTVAGLGTFIEVEAIDKNGTIGKEKIQEQCNYYASLFKIDNTDYIAESYSDMIAID